MTIIAVCTTTCKYHHCLPSCSSFSSSSSSSCRRCRGCCSWWSSLLLVSVVVAVLTLFLFVFNDSWPPLQRLPVLVANPTRCRSCELTYLDLRSSEVIKAKGAIEAGDNTERSKRVWHIFRCNLYCTLYPDLKQMRKKWLKLAFICCFQLAYSMRSLLRGLNLPLSWPVLPWPYTWLSWVY